MTGAKRKRRADAFYPVMQALEIQAFGASHKHVRRKRRQAIELIRVSDRARLHVTGKVNSRTGRIGVGKQSGAVAPAFAQNGFGIWHGVVHKLSRGLVAR